jgi:L-ascorbate metabolism protein UlaG (beta-lactamase superfamily)
MLGHIGSFLAYAATRGARHRADQQAQQEFAATAALGLAPGLTMTWLGAAGFALHYQNTTILIDPYVTRMSLRAMVGRRPVVSDPAAVAAWTSAADAILVGHTHFDHALDVPAIAKRFGCPVYGSASLRHLMQLHGQAERAVEVIAHEPYEVGPFRFSFVPSLHSKLYLGLATPSHGELTCEHLDHLTPLAYNCGQVWGIRIEVAGQTFYHQGSADLLDDEIRGGPVDYFLCGIAGRRFTRNYAARILCRLQPRVVVPTHYDNFFHALDQPLNFSLNVNLAGFPDEVRAVSTDFALCTLPLGQPLRSA